MVVLKKRVGLYFVKIERRLKEKNDSEPEKK